MKPFHLLALSALGVVLMSSASQAQSSWLTRPIHVLVPFAPGTVTDIVPRLVFEQVSAQLGQTFVIENRPGAGGTTGAGIVAKAGADENIVLVNSSAHTIAPALYTNLGYDPARDFAAVLPLGVVPNVLVVSSASGFKTVADLVAAANAKPGGMSFGSAGVGSATHLSAMRFLASAGFDAVHIPFKGGTEAVGEIIAGRLDFFFLPVANALPFVKDGALTALVVNSAKRSAVLPNVPTTAEAGFSNAEYPFWIGTFVPAKTPRTIIDRLHDEATTALATPALKAKFEALGVDPMPMSTEEFGAFVVRQIASDAALAKTARVKPQ